MIQTFDATNFLLQSRYETFLGVNLEIFKFKYCKNTATFHSCHIKLNQPDCPISTSNNVMLYNNQIFHSFKPNI